MEEGKNKYYEGSSSLGFPVGPISWKGKGRDRKKANIKLEREREERKKNSSRN